MTQDEIIEMARQAGFYADEDGAINDGIETAADFSQELEAFAKLVADKEREEILNYAKSEKFSRLRGEFAPTADDLVRWIKKRGQA